MGNPLDQPSADKGVSLAVAAEEEELELGDEDGVMFMSECIHCGRNVSSCQCFLIGASL